MRNVIGVVIGLWLLALGQVSRALESTWEYAVQVSATVQASPPQIRLNWPQDTGRQPTSYRVYRKAPQATSWGVGVPLPGTATSYVDTHVRIGTAYEYQIVKHTPAYIGYGYIFSGIEVPSPERRGTLLLVVDQTYAADLASELAQLQQDLAGDGWRVRRFDVHRNDPVARIKHLIQAQYRAAPTEVKCVFLFGHVPVPYSGNIMPDGHGPDHQGAWPCDGYYGDMNGIWTDQTVQETRASNPRNHNVPGDHKFDQNTFPAPLKLMVGRVDLANMPGRLTRGGPATFPNELELLRNYLNKDHKFRTHQFDLPPRGLVGDFFGLHDGEAFAASAWRNLAPLLGPDHVRQLPEPGTWISTLSRTPCLWAYGCGPGTYESIAGLGTTDRHYTGTTAELVHHDVKAAFILLYGSWQGDWDAEDDLLRSVLALPTYGLACAWSGRPHWFLHHMGLGETIGFGARLTQNNGPDGLYHTELNTAAGQIHIALMGDPTLRLQSVAPPTDLSCTTNDTGLTLRWTASNDSVLGYHVYRAASPDGPFTRLTPSPVVGTSYTIASAKSAAHYMVRAIKLETSASGTYFNLSQGAFPEPAAGLDIPPAPLARHAPSPSTAPPRHSATGPS